MEQNPSHRRLKAGTPCVLLALSTTMTVAACGGADARENVTTHRASKPAQAVPVVEPGSQLVDAARIRPFHADAGRFEITFRNEDLGGQPILSIETRLIGSGLPGLDYMAIDRNTLGLRMRNTAYMAFGGHQLSLIVEGTRARGALVPFADSAAATFDVELGVAPFEEFLLGWVLASLELTEGAEFRLPTIAPVRDAGPFKTRWYNARVVGTEARALVTGGDEVTTRVVEFAAEDGTSAGTFWLAEEPPYVVRREQSSGGRTSTMQFRAVRPVG